MQRFLRMSVVLLIVTVMVSAVWLSRTGEQVKKPKAAADSTEQAASEDGDRQGDGSLQEVIAEGAGAAPGDALKDAFRNAVRQVVGSVVDAETLVKNDELVDDKVLTYSDGFIKTFDKVAGSEKQVGGIHRVKIKAKVERRSVEAKLKAANVTMKAVDGKGLFAEAVTQLEAEQDASALLRKAFTNFPQNCLTATVIGKPEVVEKTADKAMLRIQVQVEPDLKAYKKFSEGLVTLLDKFAQVKGESHLAFQYGRTNDFEGFFLTPDRNNSDEQLVQLMPKAFGNDHFRPDRLAIAVATHRTANADRMEFRCFLVDYSLGAEMNNAVFRLGNCKLMLMDSDANSVAVDHFTLSQSPQTQVYHSCHLAYFGGLRFPRSIRGSYGNEADIYRIRKDVYQARESFAIVAPVFFSLGIDSNFLNHVPKLTFTRSIILSLDELKSVQSLKCEIAFDE